MKFFAPLRHPGFKNLWLGQAISQMGDALYYIVFMFMVKRVTGSNAMVGYVGALETIPFLLFSAYSGILADKIDRKRILLVSDLLCGSLLLAFAGFVLLVPKPPFAVIGIVAFTLSSIRVFFWPAKGAAIPRLVPEDAVMAANALSSMTQNVMFLAGLGFSGMVLAGLNALSPTYFFATTFAINAMSFYGSAFYIAKLPKIEPERTEEVKHPIQEMREGVRYIRGRSELMAMLGLQLLMTLFISPFFPVFIATNDAWFGGKPETLAALEAAFFAGFTVGSIVVGSLNLKRPGLGFIWGLAATGGTVAVMALTPSVWLFAACNVAAGLAVPFASIPMTSYLQVSVEDAFRGRVNSALNMAWMGMQPVGLALAGVMLDKAGILRSFAIMGSGMTFAALLGLAHGPFRRSEMPAAAAETPTNQGTVASQTLETAAATE
ncbi:MAG: MFS transporter [Armatimonadetes bacterium]|nr:MFS transporter [Armatimonadota bacterium]